MKKVFLFTLLLTPFFLFSQSSVYRPFPTQYGFWNYQYWDDYGDPTSITRQYYLSGDTIVGGLTYHFITGPSDRGLIREDNKVVYFIPDTSTVEYRLYDFNLALGDTITFSYGAVSTCPFYPPVVWEIDSIIASDGYHRMYRITNGAVWIEGVGNIWALLQPLGYGCVSGNDFITCAMNDSLFDFSPHGYSCTNVGQPLIYPGKAWTIFPNPTTSHFTMEWEPESMTEFVLTDALGRVLWEVKAENAVGKQFELPARGVYLLIGKSKQGAVTTRRVVRE